MEKENQVLESEIVSDVFDEEEVIEFASKPVELSLSREKVKSKNGQIYHNYVVKGVVIGANGGKHEGKARLVPYDAGGYPLLDVLFDGAKEVPLRCSFYKRKNQDGSIRTGYEYFAYSLDKETGEVCSEIQLKTFQPSDKDWLNIFIKNSKK